MFNLQQLFQITYFLPIIYVLLLNFAGLFAFLRQTRLCINFTLVITSFYATFLITLFALTKGQNFQSEPWHDSFQQIVESNKKLAILFLVVGLISLIIFSVWNLKNKSFALLKNPESSNISKLNFILKNYGIYIIGLILCLFGMGISSYVTNFLV